MAVQLGVGHARLLRPGEGEPIAETPNRELRLLCAHELLTLSWFRYGEGERGAAPHIHMRHADVFYVLSGRVTVRLGPEQEPVVATPGTLVLVPAGVIHSFDNEGPGEARFLNVHAPDAGFAEYLRTGAPFDQHEPPSDGGRPPSEAIVRRAGEGEALAIGPSTLLMKARGSDGDGTLYFGEATLGPGFPGPRPHFHERHVDSFFVLDGTLTLRLGDDITEAPAGSYAVVPPGNAHTFSNPGEGTVRVLNIMAPGGFEQYLEEAAAAGQADPAALAEIASRYDFTAV
jgi:mannose-6-phosphate isomerase-like protein (cupin superfamily)